jgi:hypothetical protein
MSPLKWILFAVIGLSVAFVACDKVSCVEATKDRTEKTRKLEAFTSVDIDGTYDVTIVQDGLHEIDIATSENVQDLIQTEVGPEGKLKVTSSRCIEGPRPQLRLHVTELFTFEMDGAGTVGGDSLESSRLELKLSGATRLDMANLQVDVLELNLNGAGRADLTGSVRQATYTISGAGAVKAADVQAEEANVAINGAGKARVFASASADITINGAGNVQLGGNPDDISQEVNGSGKIKRISVKPDTANTAPQPKQ